MAPLGYEVQDQEEIGPDGKPLLYPSGFAGDKGIVLDPKMREASDEDDDPSEPCIAYKSMLSYWRLITALRSGSKAMRLGADDWLPRFQEESPQDYNIRSQKSFLFPGYADAISALVAKPFGDPVRFDEKETSPEIIELGEDVDLQGTSLTLFAWNLLDDAIAYGKTHILVDMPPKVVGRDLRRQKDDGIRPYFVHYKATEVLGWRYRRVAGETILTQLRVREMATLSKGQFGDELKERIRVYNRDADGNVTWQLWEHGENKKWVVVQDGIVTLPYIPLITLYTNRKGFMSSVPPLWHLAETNLCHWQSASDQRNLLSFARAGILFGTGLRKEEVGQKLSIGASRMLIAGAENAKLMWVEHSGKAIEAGRQDLLDLVDTMILLGLKPMLQQRLSVSNRQTATNRVLDQQEQDSDLRAWAVRLQEALDQCFGIAGEWMELSEPRCQTILSDDFGLKSRDATDLQTLVAARQKGDISRETFWAELKRRSVLSDRFDPKAEKELLAKEPPPLASLMPGRLGGGAGRGNGTQPPPGGGGGPTGQPKAAQPAEGG